jgi:hypothetical protein
VRRFGDQIARHHGGRRVQEQQRVGLRLAAPRHRAGVMLDRRIGQEVERIGLRRAGLHQARRCRSTAAPVARRCTPARRPRSAQATAVGQHRQPLAALRTLARQRLHGVEQSSVEYTRSMPARRIAASNTSPRRAPRRALLSAR